LEIITHPCILLIIWFCTFVSHVEFLNSSSSSFSQIEFLMQWHFLLSNCEIAIRFILLIAFSFNLDGYFPCCRKAISRHLGFLYQSCISDWKYALFNVCFLVRSYACV
jgi:hypothetical protein